MALQEKECMQSYFSMISTFYVTLHLLVFAGSNTISTFYVAVHQEQALAFQLIVLVLFSLCILLYGVISWLCSLFEMAV